MAELVSGIQEIAHLYAAQKTKLLGLEEKIRAEDLSFKSALKLLKTAWLVLKEHETADPNARSAVQEIAHFLSSKGVPVSGTLTSTISRLPTSDMKK